MTKKKKAVKKKGPIPFDCIQSTAFPDLKAMQVNEAVLVYGYDSSWISCRFANENKRSGHKFSQHQISLVSDKQKEVTHAALVMRYD
jgi:hypothetical protein